MSQSPKFTYFTQEPTNKRIYDEREDEDSPFDSSPVDMECTSIQERIPQQHQLNQEQQQQQQQQASRQEAASSRTVKKVKIQGTNPLQNPITADPTTPRHEIPENKKPGEKDEEWRLLLLKVYSSISSILERATHRESAHGGTSYMMDVGTLERLLVAYKTNSMVRTLVRTVPVNLWKLIVLEEKLNSYINEKEDNKTKNQAKEEKEVEKVEVKGEIKGDGVNDDIEISKTHNSATLDNPSWWEFLEVVGTKYSWKNNDNERDYGSVMIYSVVGRINKLKITKSIIFEFILDLLHANIKTNRIKNSNNSNNSKNNRKKKKISDEMVQIIIKELEISIEQGKNEYKIESILEFIDKLDHTNNEKISEKMKEITDKLVNTIMETSTETMSKVEGQEDYEQYKMRILLGQMQILSNIIELWPKVSMTQLTTHKKYSKLLRHIISMLGAPYRGIVSGSLRLLSLILLQSYETINSKLQQVDLTNKPTNEYIMDVNCSVYPLTRLMADKLFDKQHIERTVELITDLLLTCNLTFNNLTNNNNNNSNNNNNNNNSNNNTKYELRESQLVINDISKVIKLLSTKLQAINIKPVFIDHLTILLTSNNELYIQVILELVTSILQFSSITPTISSHKILNDLADLILGTIEENKLCILPNNSDQGNSLWIVNSKSAKVSSKFLHLMMETKAKSNSAISDNNGSNDSDKGNNDSDGDGDGDNSELGIIARDIVSSLGKVVSRIITKHFCSTTRNISLFDWFWVIRPIVDDYIAYLLTVNRHFTREFLVWLSKNNNNSNNNNNNNSSGSFSVVDTFSVILKSDLDLYNLMVPKNKKEEISKDIVCFSLSYHRIKIEFVFLLFESVCNSKYFNSGLYDKVNEIRNHALGYLDSLIFEIPFTLQHQADYFLLDCSYSQTNSFKVSNWKLMVGILKKTHFSNTKQLERLENISSTKLCQKEAENANLKKEMSLLDQQLADSCNQLVKLEADFSVLNNEHVGLVETHKQIIEKYTESTDLVGKLKTENHEHKTNITELNEKTVKYQQDILGYKHNVVLLNEQIQQQKGKINELEKSKSEKSLLISQLSDQNAEISARNSVLSSQLQIITDGYNGLLLCNDKNARFLDQLKNLVVEFGESNQASISSIKETMQQRSSDIQVTAFEKTRGKPGVGSRNNGNGNGNGNGDTDKIVGKPNTTTITTTTAAAAAAAAARGESGKKKIGKIRDGTSFDMDDMDVDIDMSIVEKLTDNSSLKSAFSEKRHDENHKTTNEHKNKNKNINKNVNFNFNSNSNVNENENENESKSKSKSKNQDESGDYGELEMDYSSFIRDIHSTTNSIMNSPTSMKSFQQEINQTENGKNEDREKNKNKDEKQSLGLSFDSPSVCGNASNGDGDGDGDVDVNKRGGVAKRAVINSLISSLNNIDNSNFSSLM